jgi:L-alanine-DL-glutamate epimerase-like enolase superfamily enzyme
MYISKLEIAKVAIPLTEPFITSLRRVDAIEALICRLWTDEGLCGYGAASPTAVITGDTMGSIADAMTLISKKIMGISILDTDGWQEAIRGALVHNTSAKAAVNIACHDLYAKTLDRPLYQLLGGAKDVLDTDLTLNMNPTKKMVEDAQKALDKGYQSLKVKVGSGVKEDLERLLAIQAILPEGVSLRIDANQGWTAKEAIVTIDRLIDAGVAIDLVEQPVPAGDLKAMVAVTQGTTARILADESLYSLKDAVTLIREGGCDLFNLKLMKTGGIDEALTIDRLARAHGITCMMGSMMESRVGLDAAAHLAAGSRNITRVDLDVPTMYEEEPVSGDILYEGAKIFLGKGAGLGIHEVRGARFEEILRWKRS